MAEKNSLEDDILYQKENSIVKCWNSLTFKPTCIVFDLDYTLWPFIIDHIIPPFQTKLKNNRQSIFDYAKKEITHYEDVTIIIKTLKEKCFQNNEYLAIASRATAQIQALQLIDLFGWTAYFSSVQIYSGIKLKHMNEIKNDLNLRQFDQVLFFDDSKSNVEQTESLGLVAYKLKRHYGLSIPELIKGLKKYDLVQKKS